MVSGKRDRIPSYTAQRDAAAAGRHDARPFRGQIYSGHHRRHVSRKYHVDCCFPGDLRPADASLNGNAHARDPDHGCGKRQEVKILEGDIPSPVHPPEGCKFHTRASTVRKYVNMASPNGSKRLPIILRHAITCLIRRMSNDLSGPLRKRAGTSDETYGGPERRHVIKPKHDPWREVCRGFFVCAGAPWKNVTFRCRK